MEINILIYLLAFEIHVSVTAIPYFQMTTFEFSSTISHLKTEIRVRFFPTFFPPNVHTLTLTDLYISVNEHTTSQTRVCQDSYRCTYNQRAVYKKVTWFIKDFSGSIVKATLPGDIPAVSQRRPDLVLLWGNDTSHQPQCRICQQGREHSGRQVCRILRQHLWGGKKIEE